jgi:hypothetical protein
MSRILQINDENTFLDNSDLNIRKDSLTDTFEIRYGIHTFLFDENTNTQRVSQFIWRNPNENDRIYDVNTNLTYSYELPTLEHHLSLYEYENSFHQIQTRPNGVLIEIKQIFSLGHQEGGFWLLKVNQNEYVEIYRYMNKLKFSFGIFNNGVQRRNIVRITIP